MKSSESLKLARVSIQNERETFVCHALERIAGGADTAVYRYIRELTNDCAISHWLQYNCECYREFTRNSRPREHMRAMKEYRLRWIDHLTKQYEAEGD